MLSLTANFGSKDTPDPGAKHLKILHLNRRKIPCGSYASEMTSLKANGFREHPASVRM